MNSKSIASRFFTSISVLIIVSISLLGATFLTFLNQYVENDRLKILNLCVESVEDNLIANYNMCISYIEDIEPMTENLRLISDTTQTTVMIADLYGNVITCTDSENCQTNIPTEAMELANASEEIIRVTTGDAS